MWWREKKSERGVESETLPRTFSCLGFAALSQDSVRWSLACPSHGCWALPTAQMLCPERELDLEVSFHSGIGQVLSQTSQMVQGSF